MKKVLAALAAAAVALLAAGCTSGGEGHSSSLSPSSAAYCAHANVTEFAKHCADALPSTGATQAAGSPSPGSAAYCHDTNMSQADWAEHCSGRHEGSVTTASGSVAKYPNGAVVRLARVATLSRHQCDELKPSQSCVLVLASLHNGGRSPINFRAGMQYEIVLRLFYGANRYEAEDDGYMGGPGDVHFPERCVPGTTVRVGAAFAVPTSQLGSLAVRFQAPLSGDRMTAPYTFTHVESLLRK